MGLLMKKLEFVPRALCHATGVTRFNLLEFVPEAVNVAKVYVADFFLQLPNLFFRNSLWMLVEELLFSLHTLDPYHPPMIQRRHHLMTRTFVYRFGYSMAASLFHLDYLPLRL
jgi:hypothetical protein